MTRPRDAALGSPTRSFRPPYVDAEIISGALARNATCNSSVRAPRTDFCIRWQLAPIAPRSQSPMDRRRLSALYLGPVRRGSPSRTRPGRRAPRRPAGVFDRARSHNA